ncbi:MAG: hypothetical protein FWG14_07215 [Peptococcaceae bacterium]|nr:hypothetical protein [Peptococcaceae bacterium]
MNSSGVLAFYLSESEDPDLWRVMAQLSQDDRTEVFRNALRYFVTSYDGPIFAGDSEEEERDDDSLAPSLFSSSPTSYESHESYDSYESEEPHPYGEANTVSGDAYTGSGEDAEDTEWFEDEDTSELASQEARHTLSPDFSQSQKDFHAEQLRKMFPEPEEPPRKAGWVADYGSGSGKRDKMFEAQQPRHMETRAAPRGRVEQTVVQPELQEVALDEVFSDDPISNTRPLRGLDFLLKNVIGEETDEAVLEAIRRRKAAAN